MAKWPGNHAKRESGFGRLTRSQLMSRVRSNKNATTELRMMRLLREYRLSGWRREYPLLGNPDFVWPKYKVILFVDGCFWHGHDCRSLKPRRNARLWAEKIERTKIRDRRNNRMLHSIGWKILRVWECSLKNRPKAVATRVRHAIDS